MMAKGCMYYVIQEYDDGGWKTVSAPIRETAEDIRHMYVDHCKATSAEISVRLVEMRVFEQRNGEAQKMP